jgi:hypothetical protein
MEVDAAVVADDVAVLVPLRLVADFHAGGTAAAEDQRRAD